MMWPPTASLNNCVDAKGVEFIWGGVCRELVLVKQWSAAKTWSNYEAKA